jgi:Kef-type K+ transport system membrane component KefB
MSSVHDTETLLFFTLLQLAVIVVAGRVGGVLANRCGQAAVVGEILIGIALGPSLFGWVAPEAFATVFRSSMPEPLQMLSGLGVVLLMFQVGLEFDFSHLRERTHRNAVLRVAIATLAVPFGCGLALGYLTAPLLSPSAQRDHSALFIATAFSITALPVLGRIMLELKITRMPLAVIAISAAAINDVVGWLLLALVTMVAVTHFDGESFALRVLLVAAFVFVCIWAVRPVLKKAIRASGCGSVATAPGAPAARLPANLVAGMLAAVFLAGMATYELGIFAIFGGFMMGVILFDEPRFVAAWRERVGEFVLVFFLPIFFTYTGLRTSISGIDTPAAWGWCAIIIVVATLAKLGAGYLAARSTGLNHGESTILGFMMNTRGLMELIVINVGLDLGVISQQMFTILVIMSVVSNVITTPIVRHYLPRVSSSLSGSSFTDPITLR